MKQWCEQIESLEMAQAQDLIDNCKNKFQFAKTHTMYAKDWEKTKQQMETSKTPSGISKNLLYAMIDASEKVMQMKLEKVRDAFYEKFGESIYNYIKDDELEKLLEKF